MAHIVVSHPKLEHFRIFMNRVISELWVLFTTKKEKKRKEGVKHGSSCLFIGISP